MYLLAETRANCLAKTSPALPCPALTVRLQRLALKAAICPNRSKSEPSLSSPFSFRRKPRRQDCCFCNEISPCHLSPLSSALLSSALLTLLFSPPLLPPPHPIFSSFPSPVPPPSKAFPSSLPPPPSLPSNLPPIRAPHRPSSSVSPTVLFRALVLQLVRRPNSRVRGRD